MTKTNAELAEEIAPEIKPEAIDLFTKRISLALSISQWQQIIAALRSGPEASSQCPMCGTDTPHRHSVHQVVDYLKLQAARFLQQEDQRKVHIFQPYYSQGDPQAWLIVDKDDGHIEDAVAFKDRADRYNTKTWDVIPLYAERPPSGEMVMGLRVVVNPSVPADEVWITNAHGKRLGTIVNLSTAEAEGGSK